MYMYICGCRISHLLLSLALDLVRVMLETQFAVGSFDGLVICIPGHAQPLVIVELLHKVADKRLLC